MKCDHREVCYRCYRPKSSCICSYITPLETKTHFVILMHPKEFKKTKNGTGHFTHLSLIQSELHVGIDFTAHKRVNDILTDPKYTCYLLYPDQNSIDLYQHPIGTKEKQTIIFLLDATWPCSKAMLTASPNLDALPKVSFSHTETSGFTFKRQPKAYCLSTMESTLCVLKHLNAHQVEKLEEEKLQRFLQPFEKMVDYQVKCAKE